MRTMAPAPADDGLTGSGTGDAGGRPPEKEPEEEAEEKNKQMEKKMRSGHHTREVGPPDHRHQPAIARNSNHPTQAGGMMSPAKVSSPCASGSR